MDDHSKRVEKFKDFSGQLETVACSVCRVPPSPRLVYKTARGIGFWDCPGCGLRYASPRFTAESLLAIYENELFTPLSIYDDWSYEKWKNAGDRRSYVTESLKVQMLLKNVSAGARILDVGCATGLFCYEAIQQGLKAEGIDPSELLVETGRKALGISLHQGLVENFDPGYKYKAIVIWDVLEHAYNPAALLKECHRLIEPGGYLLAQVPNYEGLSNRTKTVLCRWGLKKSEFKHFGFPWHVYAFNKKSLDTLMRATGFKPLVFESWSHKLKEGAKDPWSKMMATLAKEFYLSDYITCLARKL